MNHTERRRFLLLAIPGLCLSLGSAAQSEAWPSRPVKVIVASGPGGALDIVARLLCERLSVALGQPFVIENRPGSGGHLGSEMVARAPANGYTLLMSGSPTHSVGPHLYKNLKYDPMRDVPPVAIFAAAPNLLVVNATSPISTLPDLVRSMRANPGKLSYSSAGSGTSGHLGAELLKNLAKVHALHVPYKSGPDALGGLLSGSVDFMFFTPPSTLPLVQSGRLRALAITSLSRSPLAPEVPTVSETGFPNFEVVGWYAMFAPKGVPPEVTSRLAKATEAALTQREVREKIMQQGVMFGS